MQIHTEVFGETDQVSTESDIASLVWDGGKLAIKLAQMRRDSIVLGLDIMFLDVRAFRVLDESELSRYWISPNYVGQSHVLKVLAGGWCSEESDLQGITQTPQEWLVVTGNACVSVIAVQQPAVLHSSWTW